MLSDEREKEIRAVCLGSHLGWPGEFMRQLLAEIDSLRAELKDRESNVQELQKVAESWMHDCDKLRGDMHLVVSDAGKNLITERDALKAEIEKLKAENQRIQDNRNTWKKDSGHWYDEMNRLKEENVNLKNEHCRLVMHTDNIDKLKEDNQRLKERIDKLIEAVLWASPCGQNWITPEQHPSYETIGKVMREAIVQDQKAANG